MTEQKIATAYPPSTDEWIAFVKSDLQKHKDNGVCNDSHTAPICVGNLFELFARIESDKAENTGLKLALGEIQAEITTRDTRLTECATTIATQGVENIRLKAEIEKLRGLCQRAMSVLGGLEGIIHSDFTNDSGECSICDLIKALDHAVYRAAKGE